MRPNFALGLAAAGLALAGSLAGGEQPTLLPPVPVAEEKAAPADPPPVSCSCDAPKDAPPRIPELLGDQAPIGSLLHLPSGQITGRGTLYVPSARYFKISDNDSPQPQTRSYFSFNYFYNLGSAVNERIGDGIQHTRIHREIWGWEWASADGLVSLGLRLPLDTYNAANTVPGLDGTSTDIGDLSVIIKWLLWRDSATGSLLSAGLAVTPPTGPGSFAGSNDIKVFHHTGLQPYCGWIWSHGRFYLQGFSAVDAVADLNDVVVLDNSIAAGYFLYQGGSWYGLSAVIPTLEAHVHTPLNHRGILSLRDPAATPDMVDLTSGLQFEYRDKSSFGVAFAVPVTGPRMFDFQILAQCRYRY
jgi:hypothetical protein